MEQSLYISWHTLTFTGGKIVKGKARFRDSITTLWYMKCRRVAAYVNVRSIALVKMA
jgi:hypothetical protein